MAKKEDILKLKKGDKVSYKNESKVIVINDIFIKDKYSDDYGETDKCITINGLDWYLDEITILSN